MYHWFHTIARQFPQLSQPQAFGLAAFSLGLAVARRCTLSVVAEALAWLGKPDTVEWRLQRFLSNPNISWQQGCVALAAWVLMSLVPRGVVVLIVDETSLTDKVRVAKERLDELLQENPPST